MGSGKGTDEVGVSDPDAIDEAELAAMPDARIEESFALIHAQIERLTLRRLCLLAEIDRRRSFERDGYLSAAPWLASRFDMAHRGARRMLGLAQGIARMPLAREAAAHGQIGSDAVGLLVRARELDPVAFEASEPELVEAARVHPVGELFRVLRRWCQLVEVSKGDDLGERLRARRFLHSSVLLDGMIRLDAELDPECGEHLLSALGAVMDAEARSGRDEVRSAAQRRADALEQVCRSFLDRTDRALVGGERPHLTLTVGLDVLQGARGVAELDHVGAVGASLARRLACDASVRRVVLSGTSEPLDVGRASQVVPPGLRRAVIVRDRHCRFPGCDRPHGWCDAHHVVHWADGGPTALSNLVLLCRRHHRAVHAGGFALAMVDGTPQFRRPDGSMLEDRREDRAPPGVGAA